MVIHALPDHWKFPWFEGSRINDTPYRKSLYIYLYITFRTPLPFYQYIISLAKGTPLTISHNVYLILLLERNFHTTVTKYTYHCAQHDKRTFISLSNFSVFFLIHCAIFQFTLRVLRWAASLPEKYMPTTKVSCALYAWCGEIRTVRTKKTADW